jgi:hypothetical protein
LTETNRGLIAQLKTLGETELELEYRTIRGALIDAGMMTSNLDSLYRDWQRWREESKIRASERLNSVALDVDQWWARHLSQFRSLMDSTHLAARIVRARKDARNDSKTLTHKLGLPATNPRRCQRLDSEEKPTMLTLLLCIIAALVFTVVFVFGSFALLSGEIMAVAGGVAPAEPGTIGGLS